MYYAINDSATPFKVAIACLVHLWIKWILKQKLNWGTSHSKKLLFVFKEENIERATKKLI